MTLLYYDSRFQEHRTGNHPECGERLERVVRHLQWTGLDTCCRKPAWEPLAADVLGEVHEASFVRGIRALAERGGGMIGDDTVLSRGSFDAVSRVAGAAWDAVGRITTGEDRQAFCLSRPPGHHASREITMGFCLFNHVALAAHRAIGPCGLDRVLIVDWDVHHGNGTQDLFWDNEQVGFLSIHRWPFFPGTGAASETGAGPGLGTTCNVPLEFGTPREVYRRRFRRALEDLAARIQPQLVIVSAGFDAHHHDPVGSLGLEPEDFAVLTRDVLEVADQYAGGRLLSVLEGGYDPGALTDCVDAHLNELLDWEARRLRPS